MTDWFNAIVSGGLNIHDHSVKYQNNYNQNNNTGYGVTYEEGQRLWKEHRDDGKAKSVLDSHWRFATADGWNGFADGYDDAKNADGEVQESSFK